MVEAGWIGNAITAMAALGGSLIASMFTLKGTSKQLANQGVLESIKHQREDRERKFVVYNKFIAAVQSNQIVNVNLDQYANEYETFNMSTYKLMVRPVLYEALHIIDRDVRQCLKALDSKVSVMEYMNEIADFQDEYVPQAIGLYRDLINSVEAHYDSDD